VFGHQIEQEGEDFGINGIPLYVKILMVIGATNTGTEIGKNIIRDGGSMTP